MKKAELIKKHPRFLYKSYLIKQKKGTLTISFVFQVEPDIVFKPRITFSHLGKHFKKLNSGVLNNLAFHLGLAEIPSYWKTTCSPEIVIQAGVLDNEQVRFWQKLLIKGLGEFFYINKIDFTKDDFVKIISQPSAQFVHAALSAKPGSSGTLVPVGGGKDSVVTLEAMGNKKYNCLLLNPTKASLRVAKIAGCKNPVIVKRYIDKSYWN